MDILPVAIFARPPAIVLLQYIQFTKRVGNHGGVRRNAHDTQAVNHPREVAGLQFRWSQPETIHQLLRAWLISQPEE